MEQLLEFGFELIDDLPGINHYRIDISSSIRIDVEVYNFGVYVYLVAWDSAEGSRTIKLENIKTVQQIVALARALRGEA